MPPGSGPPPSDGKSYRSQGNVTRFWGTQAPEVMLSGPAGTGKSRAILEWQYILAKEWPGSRHAIVRDTRASLTDSALVTFEEHVVGGRPSWVANNLRAVRRSYIVPCRNGGFSEIVVRGLDKPDRFMSTEFDTIYVQEAREIAQSAWEELSSRLRNDRVPFQQMLGDTNPDGPAHWILQRSAPGGLLQRIDTVHEDNPAYWDADAQDWTPRGRVYMDRLERLTGVRYKRLRQGLWVGAEGLVYEAWDPAVHVIAKRKLPSIWKRDLFVDFGFTNAFCAQVWAVDPMGRLYLEKEWYGTQRRTAEWAHDIHNGTRGMKLARVVTDHAKLERLELERHLGHGAEECPDRGTTKKQRDWNPPTVPTQPAFKGETEKYGIELVQQRLERQEDGYPRLFVMRGARVHPPDERLVAQSAPTCTEEEFPSHVWATARSLTAGTVTLETPVDKWNHGLDLVRYRVLAADGRLNPLSDVYGKAMPEVIGE